MIAVPVFHSAKAAAQRNSCWANERSVEGAYQTWQVDYPDDPKTDGEKDIKARYDRVKGSAVNPVLLRSGPLKVNRARANSLPIWSWSKI